MRKHHNKLYFGKYTHKAVFNMPWAYKLYPTSVLHLRHWAKDDHYPLATMLAKFILDNRDKMKSSFQLVLWASHNHGTRQNWLHTNISWFTFIAACFYGFKNFSFYHAILGIALSVILVHLAFSRLTLFINNKFQNKDTLLKIKTFIEYLILITVGYFIFF